MSRKAGGGGEYTEMLNRKEITQLYVWNSLDPHPNPNSKAGSLPNPSSRFKKELKTKKE